MRIIKRNSSEETFNGEKIVNAVTKANNASDRRYLTPEQIQDIAEYVEYKCYKEFLTSAVYGMTYFTLIILEIFNMVALCFFKVLEDSRECYYFTVRKESNVDERNQNVSYNDIQMPQVIIVNQTKNPTYTLI